MLAGPIQHLQSVIFEAWQLKVSAQLADREGFRGPEFLDIRGSLQLLISVVKIHFCRGVLNGFLFGKAKGEDV